MKGVDVIKVLLELRQYRMGLIQTHDQLRFSYLAIIEGSQRVLPHNLNSNAAVASTSGAAAAAESSSEDTGISSVSNTAFIFASMSHKFSNNNPKDY